MKYKKLIEVDSTAPIYSHRIADALNKRSMTQAELAAKCPNVSEATLTAWIQGDKTGRRTEPKVNGLVEVAKVLKVSTDYLLGLSDVPTSDANLRAVCEYTGLSNEAVEFIKSTKGNIKISVESINLMLSHDNGTAFFSELSDTLKFIKHANHLSTLSHRLVDAYPDTFDKICENGYSNATNLTAEDIGRYKEYKRIINEHTKTCSTIELYQFRIGKIMQAITACEGVRAEYYIKKRGEFD